MIKRDRTRRYIIEKTAVIFNKKGYTGTSLSDLSKATHLTKGGIYGNFKNKDEVAIQAFSYNVNNIINAFSTEIENARSCFDKLMAYPKVYRKIYKDVFKNGGCPILNTLCDSDDTHPVLHKMAVETISRWKKTIAHIVGQGKKNKEFKLNTDETSTAEIMISLFEGGGLLAKSSGDESFLLSALTHIEELIESIKR